MNNKGMFYTNVDDYETKEDMMNDFIALRMYDMAKDKEIERLKEMKLHTEKYASEMEDKYILEKNKNNKVIAYIEERVKELEDINFVDILDILKGVDKE